MATTDDVLEAVERLTATYEQMNAKLEEVKRMAEPAIPPYSNGQVDWEGDTITTESEVFANVIAHGAATKAIYGDWNNRTMITLAQTVANTNPKSTIPVHYHIIKVRLNNTENKKKTFFFRQANADSWAHGFVSAWLVNSSYQITKHIGTSAPDKYSGEGRSLALNMFNDTAQTFRYYQWLSFNFDLDDAFVQDGYVYIAVSSTVASHYVGGWGIADRNYDLMYIPGVTMQSGYLPFNTTGNNGTGSGGMSNGLAYFAYARRVNYLGVEIPYNKNIVDKDLLIGFFTVNDYIYIGEMKIFGFQSSTEYKSSCVEVGRFGKVLRQAYAVGGNQIKCYRVPKEELAEETVTYNGQTYLKINIPSFASERAMYFHCIYTEPFEGEN